MKDKKKFRKPPKIASMILRCILPKKDRSYLLGDYEEIYQNKIKEQGSFSAYFWYWGQLWINGSGFLKNNFYWNAIMLKNYFKTTLRNIVKYKAYSLINVVGLAIGMAIAIIIFLWVRYEASYDRFHKNSKHIYRVYSVSQNNNLFYLQNPAPLAPALESEYPEIKKASRMWEAGNCPLKYENMVFSGSACGIESSFFEIFTFPFVSGNPKHSLSDPNFVVLTKKTAQKYFGNKDPIGKTMKFEWWGKWYDFNVTGVIENIPTNSTVQFDFLLPFFFVKKSGWNFDSWSSSSFLTYVLIQNETDIEKIQHKISGIIQRHVPESTVQIKLQPLTKIHLFNPAGGGPIIYLYIFSSIGILILLIACINFINLSTSRYITRAKEVGLRKVIGANRKQLIVQFLSESLVISLVALFFAVFVAVLLLPSVNRLLNIHLEINFSRKIIFSLFGISLITGLFSGSYPSLYFSKLQPVNMLKSSPATGFKGSLLRKHLVVIQFFFSVLLIICTSIASRQLRFLQGKDLGFNKEHVIHFKLRSEFAEKYRIIKQALLGYPDILSITIGNVGFLNNSNSTDSISWEGKSDREKINFFIHSVDYDYLGTFDLKMSQGRFFSEKFPSDSKEAFVLNEAAIKLMGIKSPVGKQFKWIFLNRQIRGKIIGIVSDYNYQSLHQKISPLFLTIAPWWYNSGYIRIKSNNTHRTIEFLEKTLKNIVPDFPFEYTFLDQDIENLYKTERRVGILVRWGTILAIFIACLGLLGLASYTAMQRTKEIGIRKVLGSSNSGIILLLYKEYSKWIVLANIIAWPIAFLIMKNWLNNFAYKTSIGIWIFVLSGLITFAIALLSVSYKSFRAAVTDPIETLRHE